MIIHCYYHYHYNNSFCCRSIAIDEMMWISFETLNLRQLPNIYIGDENRFKLQNQFQWKLLFYYSKWIHYAVINAIIIWLEPFASGLYELNWFFVVINSFLGWSHAIKWKKKIYLFLSTSKQISFIYSNWFWSRTHQCGSQTMHVLILWIVYACVATCYWKEYIFMAYIYIHVFWALHYTFQVLN